MERARSRSRVRLRRQSNFVNSRTMNARKFSLDAMITRRLRPILAADTSYTDNLLLIVEELYNETEELVNSSIADLLRNYPYLGETEAQTLLWHQDGNVQACIAQLDRSTLSRRRASRQSISGSGDGHLLMVDPEEDSGFTCTVCCEEEEAGESGTMTCGHAGIHLCCHAPPF